MLQPSTQGSSSVETEARGDSVNHPTHYNAHPSGVECIEIVRHMGFNVGNAMKYLWRADLKHADGGLEDLRKAAFYIADEIKRREAPPVVDATHSEVQSSD